LPTYETTDRFRREHGRLSGDQRAAFKTAVSRFVEDLAAGKFRPGLRVKGIVGMPGCFEITWAADGRAIFTYGAEVRSGERHIIWLAIGTHSILP
jgi:hypothetical protein